MNHQSVNKSLDSLVQQFLDQEITFDDLLAAVDKRICLIAGRAAKSFERFKPLYDYDDYKSILLFVLLYAIRSWNPQRAGFATYFERVAYSAINDVRKEMTAKSRRSNLDTYSWEVDLPKASLGRFTSREGGYERTEFWLIVGRIGLTERENIICRMILAGYKRKEIAAALGMTEAAISMSLKRIRDKWKEARK